jgi:hypothetical protein
MRNGCLPKNAKGPAEVVEGDDSPVYLGSNSMFHVLRTNLLLVYQTPAPGGEYGQAFSILSSRIEHAQNRLSVILVKN